MYEMLVYLDNLFQDFKIEDELNRLIEIYFSKLKRSNEKNY